jgi:hypothetical protein
MQGEGARAAQDEVHLVHGRRALEYGPRECRLGRSQGRSPITTGRRGRDSLQAANEGESGLRCGVPYPASSSASPGNESAAKEARCGAAPLTDGGGRVNEPLLIVRGHTPTAG